MEIILSEELKHRLTEFQICEYDEVALRQQLERYVPTYTLIKLADWPARRWKCHYRLLLGDVMHDGQSVSEVYALALLAVLQQPTKRPSTEVQHETYQDQTSHIADQTSH